MTFITGLRFVLFNDIKRIIISKELKMTAISGNTFDTAILDLIGYAG
jgi:hypothetical protein